MDSLINKLWKIVKIFFLIVAIFYLGVFLLGIVGTIFMVVQHP